MARRGELQTLGLAGNMAVKQEYRQLQIGFKGIFIDLLKTIDLQVTLRIIQGGKLHIIIAKDM